MNPSYLVVSSFVVSVSDKYEVDKEEVLSKWIITDELIT